MNTQSKTEKVALPTGFEQINEDIAGLWRELHGTYRYRGAAGTYRLTITIEADRIDGQCAVWSPLALQWNSLCSLTASESAARRCYKANLYTTDIAAERTAALQQDRNRLLERALAILTP